MSYIMAIENAKCPNKRRRWKKRLRLQRRVATGSQQHHLQKEHNFLRTIREMITESKLTCAGAVWLAVAQSKLTG